MAYVGGGWPHSSGASQNAGHTTARTINRGIEQTWPIASAVSSDRRHDDVANLVHGVLVLTPDVRGAVARGVPDK
jgi:hypothetical protein